MSNEASANIKVPRIAIEFCTQCKWNLRAAYFAQELLQTFSTSIGEIALIPATGGIFTITITITHASSPETSLNVTETVLWDRKIDGGFPETKELKNRVRNIIEPNRDLGHIDRSLKKATNHSTATAEPNKSEAQPDPHTKQQDGDHCDDCIAQVLP